SNENNKLEQLVFDDVAPTSRRLSNYNYNTAYYNANRICRLIDKFATDYANITNGDLRNVDDNYYELIQDLANGIEHTDRTSKRSYDNEDNDEQTQSTTTTIKRTTNRIKTSTNNNQSLSLPESQQQQQQVDNSENNDLLAGNDDYDDNHHQQRQIAHGVEHPSEAHRSHYDLADYQRNLPLARPMRGAQHIESTNYSGANLKNRANQQQDNYHHSNNSTLKQQKSSKTNNKRSSSLLRQISGHTNNSRMNDDDDHHHHYNEGSLTWVETKTDSISLDFGTSSTSPAASADSRANQQSTADQEQQLHQQQQQQSQQQAVAQSSTSTTTTTNSDDKYSLLQFALYNFREACEKFGLDKHHGEHRKDSLSGSLKLIEMLRNSSKSKSSLSFMSRSSKHSDHSDSNIKAGDTGTAKSGKDARKLLRYYKSSSSHNSPSATAPGTNTNDWTWKELAELVKYTQTPIQASLLKLPSHELNKYAIDCFISIMQYMGDYPMTKNQTEVECVYTILVNCHKYSVLRDEVYCQLMKQTTNNKSSNPDSCLRGWRLFSIIASYFNCSDELRPYLLKYLETAAFDKRRSFYALASLCLHNLRKTFKYQGRKNVPSVEEIAAISAGRTSKRQIYRLPGGTERVINTKSTTVVQDIIHEICGMLNVTNPIETNEFSLYCIVEGDLYTMPLNRDEYILDITTELLKNGQMFYLIFCRSVWYYPLHLDSHLYIEVVFNQIAPDYLEGLLLVMKSIVVVNQSSSNQPHSGSNVNNSKSLRSSSLMSTSSILSSTSTSSSMSPPIATGGRQSKSIETVVHHDDVDDIARIASLLHRAAGMEEMPTKDEVKYLLPKPIVINIHRRSSLLHNANNNNNSSVSESQQLTNSNNNPLLDDIYSRSRIWCDLVQRNWTNTSALDTLEAKAQCLNILQKWPLFGSCFFAIKHVHSDQPKCADRILALNKQGIHMLDVQTHETVHMFHYKEIISTRKVRSEDGALFLDLKCGNLMNKNITRVQTDQAHEISRLIKQYIEIEHSHKSMMMTTCHQQPQQPPV
ncbi:Unconventional myosin-XV, partial [Fragariocoptes setiger]